MDKRFSLYKETAGEFSVYSSNDSFNELAKLAVSLVNRNDAECYIYNNRTQEKMWSSGSDLAATK